MNKLNLFTLFFILSLSIDIINSTGVDHANQKSPASVTYTDGPAPDELKAGPSNEKTPGRRPNVKNVLQRYMVTTGAPTIETIFESSTVKSNIEAMYDEVSTEKYHSNNKHNDSEHFATVEISKKSSNKKNKQNHKNGHYMNHQFERYTNEEPNNSQQQNSYESATYTPEYHSRGSQDSSATQHEGMSSFVSIDFHTTTAHPVYKDPILQPDVHSTSLSHEHSTYNQNNNQDHNGHSGTFFSEEPTHSQTHHSSNTNFDSESAYNKKPIHQSQGPHYNAHLETLNSHSFEQQTALASSMENGHSVPVNDFKQTHHIVNHQPTPNHPASSDMHMQRFTYGERIPKPENYYLPQHESHPVYNHHPTVQHIPVVTEIPVTEVQEHHGVIEKTINVPQHGVQTKTYEVRRPAIQKQFYDIEERVVVKPAGSVVLEIDQPISKTPTGHVSTTFKENEDFGGYLPPHSNQPHPNQPHSNEPHPHQSHPQQPHPHHSQQPHSHQPHPSEQHPHQPHPSEQHPHSPHPSEQHPHQPHPSEQHSHQPHPSDQHPHQPHPHPYPHQPYPQQPHPHEQHHYQPQPHQSYPNEQHPVLPNLHGDGNGGHIILTSSINEHGHNQYLPPHHNSHNAAVRAGDHLIPSPSTNVAISDCNHNSQLSNLHDAKSVPQYSVPIASAVTMTQTSSSTEDNPFAVNIKHSEKYIDSLKKHTPTHAPSSVENSANTHHIKDNKHPANENLPMPQMISKGEPDFGISPNVQNHGESFAQQNAVPQNFGANTLYTMQSVINNDLYNMRHNEELPINKVHSHESQSIPHHANYVQINNRQQQNHHQPSPINAHVVHSQESQSIPHHANYVQINNRQQHNHHQSSPINAHVEPVHANNFHTVQNIPQNNTPQPFIVYAVTPNSHSNSNLKSKPSTVTFSTSTVSTELPFITSSTPSADYNNKPLDSNHFERLRSPVNHKTLPQTTQGHLNFIVSSPPETAAFTQVHSPGIHLHYGPNSQNQQNHHNGDAPVSHNSHEQQRTVQIGNHPHQNARYSQVPAITYHIPNSQNAHNIYMLHNNTQPVHIGQMLGALQALPIYYNGQPCYQTDPNSHHGTSTTSHASGNQQLNGNVYADHSPQSNHNNQEQQAQFRPDHLASSELPEKQDIKYLPSQQYQKLPVENNQSNNYNAQQHPASQNEHVTYSGQENLPQPNYFVQMHHLSPNKVKDNYEQNPQDSNIMYQSEHYQPQKTEPDTRPTGKRDQQHSIDRTQNTHQMTNVPHNSQIYSNHNSGSQIQYFPPNNQFQHDGHFQTMAISNGEHKQSTVSDNNTDNPARHENYSDRVDKTYQNKDSSTESVKASEAESGHSTKSPVLHIVADSHHNDDSKPSQFHDEKPINENSSEGHTNVQDSETSPTHSYYQVTNNVHPGDSSISFHPLPSQSQSHILQYLLSSKGQAAQPVGPSSKSEKHSYGLEPIKARVVSAVPMSKNAKAAGEKINTRRIVVNQPIETVQVVEEQQPITTYKQITVQEPTVYKTHTVGVKKVETSVPVLVHQLPVYSSMPVYHGHHHSYSHDDHGRGHIHFQSPIYLQHGHSMPASVHEIHPSGEYKMDSHVVANQDSSHVPAAHSNMKTHPKITLDTY